MEKSLKWKANIIYEEDDQERDWVLVDGKTTDITGIGNSNVAITVVNTTNASSILNARVEFIYYDENGNLVATKYVNVCRCLLCGCENLEFWPEPCSCENFEVTNIRMLCKCEDFEIDESPLSWKWDSEDVEVIPYTRNCIKSEIITSVTSTVEGHFNVELTNDSIKINPSEKNTGESTITGLVTISYSSDVDPNCSKKIELTHNFSSCQCEALTINPTILDDWEWNDSTTEQSFTINAANVCIDFNSINVTKVGEDKEHFTVVSAKNESDRTVSVTVKPTGRNESTAKDLEANVEITYKSGSKPSCKKAVGLKHKKMVCNCGNFEVTNITIGNND